MRPGLLLMSMPREWRLSDLVDSNQLLRSYLWSPAYLVHTYRPSFPCESEGSQQCCYSIHLSEESFQFHRDSCSEGYPAYVYWLRFSFQDPLDGVLYSGSIPNVPLYFHAYCSFQPGYGFNCLITFFLCQFRCSVSFGKDQDPLISVNYSLEVDLHSSHGLRRFVSHMDHHDAMLMVHECCCPIYSSSLLPCFFYFVH